MGVDVKTDGYVLNVDIGGFLTRHDGCIARIAGRGWTEVEKMADPIDRQKAIETARIMCERCTTGDIIDLRDMICESLAVLPTADAVPVVRCRDCKWWNGYYRECESPNWNTGTDEYIVQPAGMFCGWGERRTDERSD